MVKTKPVAPKKKSDPSKDLKKGNKKIIEENLREVKALKKGEYRSKDQPYGGMSNDESYLNINLKKLDWWNGMQDGETCRTTDEKKVHIAISGSIQENKGINIQGIPEDQGYAWYMTRIMTKSETEMKPGKRIKGK